jgi:hypothetical protein
MYSAYADHLWEAAITEKGGLICMQRPGRQDLYPSALSCEDMQAEMLIPCDIMLAGV